MRKIQLLVIFCATFFVANSQTTCQTKYAQSVFSSAGNLYYTSNTTTGASDGSGVKFDKGNSSTYTRMVWDMGEFIPKGTEVCIKVKLEHCYNSGGQSSSKLSVWGNRTGSGTFYQQEGVKTFSYSGYTYICVDLDRNCRYMKVVDEGGCAFRVDNLKWSKCVTAPSAPTCGADKFKWENNVSISSSLARSQDLKFVTGSTTRYKIPGTLPSAFNGPVKIKVSEAISWDGYSNRAQTNRQLYEQWNIIFLKNGSVVYATPYTADLKDSTFSAEWSGALGVEKYFPNGVDEIYLAHYGDGIYGANKGMGGAHSVLPMSICLEYSLPQNKISGLVWNDKDYDQIKDGAETKVDGVKVYLYDDANNNGVVDAGENAVDSVVTDANGKYMFDSLVFNETATTITKQINSSTDDADERTGAGNATASWVGFNNENSGFRFTNLSIPYDAQITNAYITFTAGNTYSGSVAAVLKGEASGNSAAFASTTNQIVNRSSTSQSLTWNLPNFTQNSTYNTPNISSIVSAIVSRSDWSNGDPITILVYGPNTSGGANMQQAYMYDADATKAPILNIEYTQGTNRNFVITTDASAYSESTVMSTDNIEVANFTSGGNHDENNDFGITPPNVVSGKVFYDKGRNGVRGTNIGEPGVKLYLIEDLDSAVINASVNDTAVVSLEL